jgi:hypothetical protein
MVNQIPVLITIVIVEGSRRGIHVPIIISRRLTSDDGWIGTVLGEIHRCLQRERVAVRFTPIQADSVTGGSLPKPGDARNIQAATSVSNSEQKFQRSSSCLGS